MEKRLSFQQSSHKRPNYIYPAQSSFHGVSQWVHIKVTDEQKKNNKKKHTKGTCLYLLRPDWTPAALP